MKTLESLIQNNKREYAIIVSRFNAAKAEVAELSAKHRLSEDDAKRVDELRGQLAVYDADMADLTEKLKGLEAEKRDDDEIQRKQLQTTDSGPLTGGGKESEYRGGDLNVDRAASVAATSAQFIRSADGQVATVARGQRFADHPIVSREVARSSARDQAVIGQHGSLGNLIRSMTTSGGSAIVPTAWASEVIDKARNASAVMSAGAQIVPMDAKTVQVGRLTGDPSAAFRAEGNAITASDPTFDNVTLTAKTMNALVVGSMEWFADAENAEALVENAIASAMALRLDLVALYGGLNVGTDLTAATNPTGLLSNLTTNASSSVLGGATNGTTQTAASFWNELIDMVYTVRDFNESPTSVIWNSKAARMYAKAYDSTYQPLRRPADLDALQWFVSNQVPSYTQGTMTNVATDVFCGDFSQLLIGQRLDVSIQVLTERYADNGQIGIVATWRGDVGVARPRAFSVYKAIKGSA